jgi:hypothetical protein
MELERLVRSGIVRDLVAVDVRRPIETRVDQDRPAARAFQHPDGHRDVERPSGIRTLYQVRNREVAELGITDRIHVIDQWVARLRQRAAEAAGCNHGDDD